MSFYLINKEPEWTSNDVLKKLKHLLDVKKAGHSGTLDPFATGLLIVATNNDTKFLSYFLDQKKLYTGEILFGKATDTYDITGEVTKTSDKVVDKGALEILINQEFIGKINQYPPIYSAKKINGVPAYKLARENKTVDLKPSIKFIYSFDIKEISKNKFSFKVEVSSGTYIRSLIHDLGEMIAVPAVLTRLNREKIDNIELKNAQKIDQDLIPYTVKDLLKIETKMISEIEMKHLLEGKLFEHNYDKKDLVIFKSKEIEVLAKRRRDDLFKINKRIN